MILHPCPGQVRKSAYPLLVRGARCGLPLMQAVDVQFQPASQIPDLLAYGGGGGLSDRDVLVDRVDTGQQAGLPVRLVSSLPTSRSPHKIGNAQYLPVLGDQLVHLELVAGLEDPPPDVHRSCSSRRGPAGLCLGRAARRIRAATLNGTARMRRPVSPSPPCRTQPTWPRVERQPLMML